MVYWEKIRFFIISIKLFILGFAGVLYIDIINILGAKKANFFLLYNFKVLRIYFLIN